MTGYKVITHKYSGEILGDAVVWANEGAARMKEAQEKEKLGEWEETKFQKVEYEIRGMTNGECRVGRLIHQLRTDSREEMVREAALKKLNAEERAALGLPAAKGKALDPLTDASHSATLGRKARLGLRLERGGA